MRLVPLIAVLGVLGTSAAVADIPPPPYQGPDHATLGALTFRHVRESGRIPVDGGRHTVGYHRDYVALAGCEGRSDNCDAVTRGGVLGWEVVSADGSAVSGDLRLLTGAFAAARPGARVKVKFRQLGAESPAREVELQLEK